MEIEFSREEIEKIILDHVNEMFVVPQTFNTVAVKYSYLPERITVSHQPKE